MTHSQGNNTADNPATGTSSPQQRREANFVNDLGDNFKTGCKLAAFVAPVLIVAAAVSSIFGRN